MYMLLTPLDKGWGVQYAGLINKTAQGGRGNTKSALHK